MGIADNIVWEHVCTVILMHIWHLDPLPMLKKDPNPLITLGFKLHTTCVKGAFTNRLVLHPANSCPLLVSLVPALGLGPDYF